MIKFRSKNDKDSLKILVTLEIRERREYDVTIAMLTPQVNSQFVEKIFTDRAGRQFRMVFLVALVDGEIKGRLVSVEQIGQRQETRDLRLGGKCSSGLLCLPTAAEIKSLISNLQSPAIHVVSPYNELFFFTSQPTRAPSFA